VAGCCSCGKQPPRYPLLLQLSLPSSPFYSLGSIAAACLPSSPSRSSRSDPRSMRWPRSPTQLALDANGPACLLPIATRLSLFPRYIDASIAIACTRNLEKSPLPLRVRHLRALRRAAESYRCTDGVRSSRGAEVPSSAAISDRDRSSVGAFRRQRIVGEGCAILEETV